MSKRTNTFWFTIIISAINIVATLLFISLLIGIDIVFLKFIVKVTEPKTYIMSFVFCFFAGMLVSMMFLGRFIDWVITKFNLEDKLAKINGRRKPKQETKEKKSEPETVMPDSVKEAEDPWETENK